MANQEHVGILRQGNRWREDNPNVRPDLWGLHLEKANLREANLCCVGLEETNLREANLEGATFDQGEIREH